MLLDHSSSLFQNSPNFESSQAVWVAGPLCGHDQILVRFHYNLEQPIELPSYSNTGRATVDDNVLL
jgi:hypothetical protein